MNEEGIHSGHVGDTTASASHVNFRAPHPRDAGLVLTGDGDISVKGSGNRWAISLRKQGMQVHKPVAKQTTRRLQPFELVDASSGGSTQVRVVVSTIAGDIPTGFTIDDSTPYILSVSDGDVIYGCVTWDISSGFPGPVTSRTFGVGSSVPDDDSSTGTFYYLIGSVSVTSGVTSPVNLAYGPIDATAFRQWFSNPPTFDVSWSANSYV